VRARGGGGVGGGIGEQTLRVIGGREEGTREGVGGNQLWLRNGSKEGTTSRWPLLL